MSPFQKTPMQVLVLANKKGGVGKTMSAIHIAWALRGRLNGRGQPNQVLVIDADEQGNLSQSFAYAPDPARTLAAVLLRQTLLVDAVYEVAPGLWLLPAGKNLNDAAAWCQQQPGAEFVLRSLLATIPLDYCVFDTPGSGGKLTDAALTAATAVFVPSKPSDYEITGLVDLLLKCRQIKARTNPGLLIGGIFFTQYNRASTKRAPKAVVQAMELPGGPFAALILRTTIRENVRLQEAVSQKTSIFDYDPDSSGARDYTLLTAELLARLTA